MITEQKLQAIRRKCVEANPEIMELRDGCIVQYEYVHGGVSMQGAFFGRMFGSEKDDQWGLRVKNCVMPIPNKTHFEKTAIRLGRPVRLADVLLAWKASRPTDVRYWHSNASGCDQDGIISSWDLRNDSLNDQSPETIDFLFRLLFDPPSAQVPMPEGWAGTPEMAEEYIRSQLQAHDPEAPNYIDPRDLPL